MGIEKLQRAAKEKVGLWAVVGASVGQVLM